MSVDERALMALQAYHDGELGLLGRWRMEWRLRRSADLRRELAELEQLATLLGEGLAELDQPELGAAASIWSDLAPELTAVDTELGRNHRAGAGVATGPLDRLRDALSGVGAWGGLAGAAVAVALLVIINQQLAFDGVVDGVLNGTSGVEQTLVGASAVVSDGSVRYLNTSGRPVAVSQETSGVTIIWLMDAPGDA